MCLQLCVSNIIVILNNVSSLRAGVRLSAGKTACARVVADGKNHSRIVTCVPETGSMPYSAVLQTQKKARNPHRESRAVVYYVFSKTQRLLLQSAFPARVGEAREPEDSGHRDHAPFAERRDVLG